MMKTVSWLSILLASVSLGYMLLAGGVPEVAPSPAREIRGAWMATVLNIDYPQRPSVDAATLQADFRSQLYRLRSIGVNAIFVQVRSAGDAIYPSQIAPWSRWLTGRQGVAPTSGFDPLAFMIKEAHATGIALHAWVNPYRASMDLDTFQLAPNHVFYQHRDWVHQYGDRLYLDPGLPQVQAHIRSACAEILRNYDVDGLHFDDYFYPYPVPGAVFPDSATFSRYGGPFSNQADWRRNNVNTLVSDIHGLIEREKPWVQFGISPFGVWRNQDVDPRGSQSRAYATSYDNLYGDALHWAREGTVDYLVPQLYWNIGFAAADYTELLAWWSGQVHPKTQLYVGHAAYKVAKDQEAAWNDLEEIPRQINLNRQNTRISGSLYFSTKSLLNSPVGLDQRLGDIYAKPVLLPEQARAVGPLPLSPKTKKAKKTSAGPLLVWEVDKSVSEDALPYYFSIYRRSAKGPLELIHITPFAQGCRKYHFFDENPLPLKMSEVSYEVRAVDRWHRESVSSSVVP